MLVWLLVACPRRGPEGAERIDALVAEADAAWARRGELGLEAAAEPLLAVWSEVPDDPRIGWRIARWRIAEGLVAEDPAQAQAAYAQAREVAIGCLDGDPLFAQRRLAEGWQAALVEVPPERLPCAAWGALAWARWIAVFGPSAASLDLDLVDALADTVSASAEGELRGVARWAEGIALAIRPEWMGRDLDAARDALQDAIRAQPDSVVRRVDLYELVVVPSGDPRAEELRRAILAREVDTPEEVAAQQRVRGSD